MRRVCVLTGASGLLGAAFIEAYAARYQIVAVHHLNPVPFATQSQMFVDPLLPSREIDTNREAVHSIRAEISKPAEIERVISEVVTKFESVDLLLNCAAVRHWSNLLNPSAADHAEELVAVNLLAPLRLSIGFAQRLWRLEPRANLAFNRNVINVSSAAGLFVYPDQGQALYAASKAALNHLTYHLASEFWDIGIRVNAVAPDTFPGRVSTESVLESILDLDSSDRTGQIVELSRKSASEAGAGKGR